MDTFYRNTAPGPGWSFPVPVETYFYFYFTFLEILVPLSPGPRGGREENVGIVGQIHVHVCCYRRLVSLIFVPERGDPHTMEIGTSTSRARATFEFSFIVARLTLPPPGEPLPAAPVAHLARWLTVPRASACTK